MGRLRGHPLLGRFLADYGMLLVLLLLCAYFSAATLTEQYPTGAAGGEQLADDIHRQACPGARVLIVARDTQEDAEFAAALRQRLDEAGLVVVATVRGQPADVRQALQQAAAAG